ncbi:hypothetical protein TNCV_3775471 [Trichonephila clavipes]|nr:hypothetical protein TNCV_3775471 [Trichonephila clavipes]
MSSASKKLVRKFQPKFQGTYEATKVEKNNVVIRKGGKLITVNVEQVRIYHPKDRDESDVETDTSKDEMPCDEHGEAEGTESATTGAVSRLKRCSPEKQNVLKRAPPSSLQEDRVVNSDSQDNPNLKKITATQSLQSGSRTKKRTSGSSTKKNWRSSAEESKAESRKEPGEQSGRVVVYLDSTPQIWGSINGLGKVDSEFQPRYIGSINEYQAGLES